MLVRYIGCSIFNEMDSNNCVPLRMCTQEGLFYAFLFMHLLTFGGR